jgi:hypothetical protein
VKLTLVLLSLFSAFAAQAATDAAIPSYLPPDTQVVIGVRVRGLVDSSLFKKIPTDFSGVNVEWTKLASSMGFDPLRDLDDVLIATNARGQDAPALIVAHGRFENLQLPSRGPMYHGIAINQGKGANGGMALLDGNTALLGDPAMIRRAIDRRGAASQLDPAMVAILNSLRVSYDIWGYGHIPPGLVPPNANAQGLDSIDRFQFGLRLSNGLVVEATLHTRTSQDGEKLVASARMLEAMVKMQQPSASAGKLDIRTENNQVHVALSVPEEALLKAMEMRRSAGMANSARTGSGATGVSISGTMTRPATGDSGVTIVGGEGSSQPLIHSAPNGDTVVVTLPGKQ